MTLSESITALVPQAEALEAQVTALTADNTFLQGERDGAVEALDVLMILAQAYLDAPKDEDDDEAAALAAFLLAHVVP